MWRWAGALSAATLVAVAALALEGAVGREVLIFLDGWTGNSTWQEWNATLTNYSVNWTTIAPCIYELDATVTFTLQTSEEEAEVAWAWSQAIQGSLGKKVQPLLAGDPGAIVNVILPNVTAQETFIAASVAEAVKRNFSGYNVDAEGPQLNATMGQKYVEFANAWADALHAVNRTLSIWFRGDCQAPDYFGATCEMFRTEGRVDRVLTEATYEGSRPEWLDFLVDAAGGLGGGLMGAGMEMSELGENNYPVTKMVELGVAELDFWVNMPTSDDAWQNIGYFLHAPAAQ